MTKYGYHRLVLSTGQVIEGPVVVTLDDHSNVIEWHMLKGEELLVIWIGVTLHTTFSAL
jgi:hypothetical protein